MTEVLLVRVPQACEMLSCSKGTLYKLMRSGAIKSVKDGAARKAVVASIHEYIARGIETDDWNRGVGQGEGQLEHQEKDDDKSIS